MESTEQKKCAFKRIAPPQKNKDNLEDVIDKDLSISVDSHPYEEIDFLMAREFTGTIRESSALKLLTANILQTYKICKNDFTFEETMKPRRELTIPHEGIIF
jgi:hypothetical protein